MVPYCAAGELVETAYHFTLSPDAVYKTMVAARNDDAGCARWQTMAAYDTCAYPNI